MSRFTTKRSKESPMDFEYTSEERRKPPVWSKDYDDPEPPRKRTFTDMNSRGFRPVLTEPQRARSTPPFAQSPTNTPFLFHTSRATPPPPNLFWKPPADFSPSKAFPSTSPTQGVYDISMEDPNSSPLASKTPKTLKPLENGQDEEANQDLTLTTIPTRKVSTSAVKRVYRERQQVRSRGVKKASIVEEDEGSDTEEYSGEENQPRRTDSITSNHHYTFNMPGIPADRSQVPYMLLGYVQFLFNLSLVLVVLYIIVHCIITVQRDVEHRISEYRTELTEQVATCAQLYKINRCLPISERVPALEKQCTAWESCMQRDPVAVGRARVVAETIGEVINSFVEPISWKALVFGLTSLAFMITLVNVLFSFYRARVAPDQGLHTHPAHTALQPIPGTPYPTTPVHPRIANFMTSGDFINSPIHRSPLHQSVGWARTWSGTDMPVPSTPTRRKPRVVASNIGNLDEE